MIMAANKENDNLDRAIAEMRKESLPADDVESSARRVWQRLEAAGESGVPPGCAEMRAALPALRQGQLLPARRLIVEAHLRECASCRAYAAGSKDPVAAAAAWRIDPSARRSRGGPARYAWAAAAVIFLAAVAWFIGTQYLGAPSGSRARIASVTGHVYRVSPNSEAPLQPGDAIGQDVAIRTGGDSRAVVTLLDGSRVEMNARTEFSVSAAFRRTSIHLSQGDIIVQAPKRRVGHLYVLTPDCTVTDTGTIFSVESGTKGSRVGVIEGTVSVAHGGTNSVLQSGESVATAQSVSAVPVSRQIEWSGDREHYLALLDEFSMLRHRLEQIPTPKPRYHSRILPLVPADTTLYFSVPNYGDMLVQADRIFRDELGRSATLRDWWNGIANKGAHPSVEEMIGKLDAASHYLGDEVVLAMSPEDRRPGGRPMLLAPIVKPGLEQFLKQQLVLATGSKGENKLRVVDEKSLAALPADSRGVVALVRPDMLVIGWGAESVRRMNARLNAGPSGFVDTEFGKQVQNVYAGGAQVLLAANLQGIFSHARLSHRGKSAPTVEAELHHNATLRDSGFSDMKYLIVTHGSISGQTETRAVLDFAGPRQGLASWLAAPSPMGSLDFVSANAGAAVSVVTKQPVKMLDDVLQLVALHGPDIKQKLAVQDAKLGLSLRQDLAAALGGEWTFALDGPVLPKPAWKFIVEVNDPARLQQSIATLVQRANEDGRKNAQKSAKGAAGPPLVLNEQVENGRKFYTLQVSKSGVLSEIDYTYANGYLVAAPSRALVMAALATHSSGDSLAASGSFRSILPRDGHTNLSGLFYQNLGPLLRPVAGQFSGQDAQALQRLATDLRPSAICAYGGSDRIEMASTGNILDLQPGAFGMLNLLGVGKSGTSGRREP